MFFANFWIGSFCCCCFYRSSLYVLDINPLWDIILCTNIFSHLLGCLFTLLIVSFDAQDFPGGSDGKSVCLQCGTPGFDPWVGKIPWRRKWQPTPVLLPGKSHGQRNQVGYNPWGHKESETTEQLHFHFDAQKFFMKSNLLLFSSFVCAFGVIIQHYIGQSKSCSMFSSEF